MDADYHWIQEAERHSNCAAGQENCKDVSLDCPRATIAERLAQSLIKDDTYGLDLLHLAVYRSDGGDITRLISKVKDNLSHTETTKRHELEGDHASGQGALDGPSRLVRDRPDESKHLNKAPTRRLKLHQSSSRPKSPPMNNGSHARHSKAKALFSTPGLATDADTDADTDAEASERSEKLPPRKTRSSPRKSQPSSTQSEKQAAHEVQKNGLEAAVPCAKCRKAFEQRRQGASCGATELFPVCKFNRRSKRKQCGRCTWLKQKCEE